MHQYDVTPATLLSAQDRRIGEHYTDRLSLLGDRFREFSIAAPVISLFKLFLDPVMVVLTLYLLSYPFDIAHDGHQLLLASFAFLLTAMMLDGVFLFVPGYSRPLMGVGRFLLQWCGVILSIMLIGKVTGFYEYYYPAYVLTWFVVAPLVLMGTHAFFRWIVLRPYHENQLTQRKAIIIGANQPGLAMARSLLNYPLKNIEFVGFFDDRAMQRLDCIEEIELLGSLRGVSEFVRNNEINQIYISLPMAAQKRVLDLLSELQDTTASIFFIPDLFVFDLINARFENVAGMPVVAVCESPFIGLNGVIKRVSDVVLSLLIIALIWPLLLLIAIAVKITSRGPILFKQRRYGADGHSVVVYKFRSMTVMEDGEKVVQATRNDQRLTPIGGFIRKTSLDELPQFINVLQGRMSIVGPRPHANAHNEQYRKLISGYMMRHKVRPGITGWAQVNGYRGETDTLEKMQRRIEYDLDYLRSWSIWLDLKIVCQTVFTVFRDKNAF